LIETHSALDALLRGCGSCKKHQITKFHLNKNKSKSVKKKLSAFSALTLLGMQPVKAIPQSFLKLDNS